MSERLGKLSVGENLIVVLVILFSRLMLQTSDKMGFEFEL